MEGGFARLGARARLLRTGFFPPMCNVPWERLTHINFLGGLEAGKEVPVLASLGHKGRQFMYGPFMCLWAKYLGVP